MDRTSQKLTDLLGIDRSDQALRLRWINFTDEDRARIRKAAEFLAPQAGEIVTKFYDHSFNFQEFTSKVSETGRGWREPRRAIS